MKSRRKPAPVTRFPAAALLAVLLAGNIAACDTPPDGPGGGGAGRDTLTIAVWNVQAFFDGDETGAEYDEYRENAGWSAEKYRARLAALGRAVEALADPPPPVLALVEVENAGVLQTLADTALSRYGYTHTFFAGNRGYSLGLGLLSRYPLFNTRLHPAPGGEDFIPRPVLEAWIEAGGRPLALFVCHWKSKLGGGDATEPLRRSAARLLQRRIREIGEEAPGTPVIVMGDLNENHDEFYRRQGAVVTALLPDDPEAAELAAFAGGADDAGYLVISREKPPVNVYFPRETVALYSPWDGETRKGSYRYRNEWETIDHFLLSGPLFDGRHWEFGTGEALHREPFVTAAGFPDTYNPGTGRGLSDHLPLLLTLKFVEAD
jgi:endonuclease/exonuclease/phosphatase family metal-dependent hydrolase